MDRKQLRMSNSYRILWILAIVIVMAGCKTTRQSVAVIADPDGNAVLLDKVLQSTAWFSSMDIKRMTVNVNMGGASYSSPASCKLIRDSVLHLSVTPFFGVEMFQVRANPREIIVIDKMRGGYYQTDYLYLKNRFGIDISFKLIQDLLTNQPFIYGDSEIKPQSFRQKVVNEKVILQTVKSEHLQETYLTEDFRVGRVTIVTDDQSMEFVAGYGDFKNQDGLFFPYASSFNATAGDTKLSFQLTINRIGFNEAIVIPDINLQSLRKGQIENLLK
jgi:hypothetical protein